MANDNWKTPPEVFNTLNKEFDFVADMASDDENNLCPLHFTEKDNSIDFYWVAALSDTFLDVNISPRNYVWVNCPYSKPMPWVKQALQAQSKGLGVVMLLNSDHSVGWFAEALKGVSEIRNIIADKKESGGYSSGRIAFINDQGKPQGGNAKPQCILVFNPFKIGANVTRYITRSELYGGI